MEYPGLFLLTDQGKLQDVISGDAAVGAVASARSVLSFEGNTAAVPDFNGVTAAPPRGSA